MSIYHFILQLVGNEKLVGTTNTFVSKASAINSSEVSSELNSHSFGGLLDGLIACGLLSLLTQNKSLANKVSAFRGAVLHTDTVSSIYENYKNAVKHVQKHAANGSQAQVQNRAELTYDYQLKIVKAMIASAKISGHINAAEKQRIFKAIAKMEISSEHKGVVFELLNTSISINEISRDIESIQHKSEIYLASCIVSYPQKASERQHLDKLAQALTLTEEMVFEIESNAIQVIACAA